MRTRSVEATTSPRWSAAQVGALERALRDAVSGDVRFDPGSRALYATTGSNYRQVPIGVVLPREVDDLVRGLAVCHQFGAPVLPRGGGTSLAGQSCNVAVVFDASKHLTRVLDIDAERRTARVEPGAVLDDLRRQAEQHGLTFGPDPSTHAFCTLGGMIGNNACGVHSVMAGRTVDNVEAMEIVTYDGIRMRVGRTSDDDLGAAIQGGGRRGEIYAGLKRLRDRYAESIRQQFPKIPRRVSGYGLDQLLPENGFNVARALVGTEGTCATILEATVRLVPSPPARVLLVLGYHDAYVAADHVPDVLAAQPIGLEGLDARLVQHIRQQGLHAEATWRLPEGGGWLLAEFGGDTLEEARARAGDLADRLQRADAKPGVRFVEEPEEQEQIWLVRESGLGATAHVPGQPLTWEGWEDSAVHPEALGRYMRELRDVLRRHGYQGDFYGHFGDGCLHTRIDFDLMTAAGVERYRAFIMEAADLVARFGGSFSGEHGDGQSRGELLPKLFGPELVQAFREFKSLWDPHKRMNPGKKIDADPIDTNLRLGANYTPAHPQTHFSYTADQGDFSRVALRCVGVGACRKTDSGTMCPSYMVTREEMHATRGRARLLHEMLQGDVVRGGWGDEHVKEALDLCLACKGCKGECPARVDMATYKAEFRAHYYRGRLRPRHAYAFGLINRWASIAALMPWASRQLCQTPGVAAILKRAAGMAPAREIPLLAPETFRQRFRRRAQASSAGERVLLWPDTFHNYFHPETADAAVGVLEELGGFRVDIPTDSLCCGRPLYDYGFLQTAKRYLRDVIDALRDDIRAGTPLVVLEPSCASVFKDELLDLFPHDEDAQRLGAQTVHFAEFLREHSDRFVWPELRARAVLHGHCHQKALSDVHTEKAVLERLGLGVELLDSGCCGMAGAFGFEESHHDVSLKIGERVLLPAVRGSDPGTLLVANGFSCREQIAQTTARQALHLAQVIQIAAHDELRPRAPYAESAYLQSVVPNSAVGPSRRETAVFAAGAAALSAAAGWMWRRLR